jgi:hypothetical protein
MNEFDPKEIMRQAETEVREERFRQAVEIAKEKIRKMRPVWDRLFPFRIILVRKDK